MNEQLSLSYSLESGSDTPISFRSVCTLFLHQGRGNCPEDRAVNLMEGQNPQFNCKATQTDLSASEFRMYR